MWRDKRSSTPARSMSLARFSTGGSVEPRLTYVKRVRVARRLVAGRDARSAEVSFSFSPNAAAVSAFNTAAVKP